MAPDSSVLGMGDEADEASHLDMAFAKPQHPVEEVNRAGKRLRAAYSGNWRDWPDDEWEHYYAAVAIINNWRSSHGYPLNSFSTTLRISARRFSEHPVIAQRTKRLASIAKKLHDLPNMKLSQMQDIGGCRAILGTVQDVVALQRYYETKIDLMHEGPAKDDYIANPKENSGYRGVHLMYRYKSDRTSKICYNGLKIEIQLRSLYQHAWATTVETAGTFVGQALKSSQGPEDWLRFFKLMSSVIAHRENCRMVPGTPVVRSERRDELAYYANILDVAQRLQRYGGAVRQVQQRAQANQEDKYFLLRLDPEQEQLQITGFPASALPEAQAQYASAEQIVRENPRHDAVLVSVDSLSALEKAYPNYFADTRLFVLLMRQELRGVKRPITVPPLNMRRPTAASLFSEDE